jgi:hypothetical protein
VSVIGIEYSVVSEVSTDFFFGPLCALGPVGAYRDEDENGLAVTDHTTLITGLLITDYSLLWQTNKSRALMR